jgi:hypothetical protein
MECVDGFFGFDSNFFFIPVFAKFVPDEVTRKLDGLQRHETWKMRQTRNFFMYVAIAVILEFRDEMKDGREFQKVVIIVTHAIR